MKKIILKEQPHNRKIGQKCEYIEPNITEDTLFVDEQGVAIGFYIKDMGKYNPKLNQLADYANKELLSDRVPKSTMNRGTKKQAEAKGEEWVTQFSTIIGGVPAKPHFRRPQNSMSSVHKVKSAKNFIKAMYLLALESEKLIEQFMPEVYAKQKEIFDTQVDPNFKFGNLFTSSISNFNIPAPFHRDTGNIKDCVNVIIAKRKNSKGGGTTIPDYGATVGSDDNSMLVYPAWRNVHGVTPIIPTKEGGYRNSLVFYPLRAFLKKDNL